MKEDIYKEEMSRSKKGSDWLKEEESKLTVPKWLLLLYVVTVGCISLGMIIKTDFWQLDADKNKWSYAIYQMGKSLFLFIVVFFIARILHLAKRYNISEDSRSAIYLLLTFMFGGLVFFSGFMQLILPFIRNHIWIEYLTGFLYVSEIFWSILTLYRILCDAFVKKENGEKEAEK